MADDPLDFSAAHDKKHGPDAEHVCRDDKGVKWFSFICSYKDGDAQFGFNIWALDQADAERRMALIAASGKVDGQVFSTFPA